MLVVGRPISSRVVSYGNETHTYMAISRPPGYWVHDLKIALMETVNDLSPFCHSQIIHRLIAAADLFIVRIDGHVLDPRPQAQNGRDPLPF